METVEVNRVQVFPCAYWKGLIQRAHKHNGPTDTGYDKFEWPTRSSLLCWQCCHHFDHVPVFLPVDIDLAKNVFYFMGNFCSWNCVKSYALRIYDHRKPSGASYISLLAFLTCHRPRHCFYSNQDKHPYTCPCIDKFKGVALAPKKELLKSFGGSQTIHEYRKDLLIIDNYDWVRKYFNENNAIQREMGSLTSTPMRRSYTFCYLSYPGPLEATVDQVYILPLTHKTLAKGSSDDTNSEQQPKSSKKGVKPCSRTVNPTGRRRFPKSNTPAPTPIASIAPQSRAVTNDTPVEVVTHPRTIEPAVSEEQAFYVNSVHKYGNLFSSMGISIEKR